MNKVATPARVPPTLGGRTVERRLAVLARRRQLESGADTNHGTLLAPARWRGRRGSAPRRTVTRATSDDRGGPGHDRGLSARWTETADQACAARSRPRRWLEEQSARFAAPPRNRGRLRTRARAARSLYPASASMAPRTEPVPLERRGGSTPSRDLGVSEPVATLSDLTGRCE